MIAAVVPSNPDTGIGAGVCDDAEMRAWMDQAACRGAGCEEFFGPGASVARGRARCRVCPVVEICFWWAVVAESDTGYSFGVWGGTAPSLRARIVWVTGVEYARARLVTETAQWAQAIATR